MNWEKVQEIIIYVIFGIAMVGIASMFTLLWTSI
jgi:hypothetical protein